jgi:RHS repeat-associated protein
MTNHLGNVLTVIHDIKIPLNNGSGPAVNSYRVGIRTCSDYSPFGVELDGRTVSGGYRFGYQGSEKDNEFKGNGNSYTTEFRQLDPRLGRWLSVDALYYYSPDWTPYRFGFNNPINTNDIYGLFESKDDAKSYKRENHIRGKISYNPKYQNWEITNKKYSYSAGNDLGFAEMSKFKNDGVIQSNVVHPGKKSNTKQNQSEWIDNFQTTLDIAGTFDPTGIVDGVNAIIYASRGEWVNAGISALAIIPYIGDLGKAEKIGSKIVKKTGEQATEVALNGLTEHAINQAITRGFKSADILKIVNEGKSVHSIGRYGSQVRYTLGGNTVVVNAQGKVVTVFSNAQGTMNGIGKGFFKPFK